MADASDAIDAAVEAVKAAAVASIVATTNDAVWQLNDDTEYFNMSGIYSGNVPALVRIAVEAAAPVLLAAERERIAREIEAKAEKGFIWTDGSGPEYEMLKTAAYSRASALGEAAAIARGGE